MPPGRAALAAGAAGWMADALASSARRRLQKGHEDLGQDLRQDRILATTRRRFVFELKRIIDDDFRGRYLERELVARSPEAIQP